MERAFGYKFFVVLAIFYGLAFSILNTAQAESVKACPYSWNRALKVGSIGDDVQKLQQFLNSDPQTQLASSGAGSPGMETSKYGAFTALAVKKFQELYRADILAPNSLLAGTGVVGASTKAKLNSLCAGASVSTTNTVSSASSTQSLPILIISQPEQPAMSLAPANAQFIPFTNITLTAQGGDVTVSKMMVRQVGLAKDAAFYLLSLLDEDGTDLSDAYLHSDHTATFGDSFTIPAGTSKTLAVTASMNADLTDYDGQMAQFQIETINSDSPSSGPLPIRGAFKTINNSLIIGSATNMLSADDPNGSQTKYISDTNVRFSGIRITAGSEEDIRLDGVNWNQVGSASGADITNIRTIVNGVSYPATNDGHSYTSIISPGIIIKKGNSVDVSVVGDMTSSGAGRTVEFDLRYSTDIYLTGLTYGFGIAPYPGGNTAVSGNSVFITDTGDTDGISGTPYFVGSVTTISAGVMQSIGR
jgi:hypothetical protein